MKKVFVYFALFISGISTVKCQEILNPKNFDAARSLSFPEVYKMNFYFLSDTLRVPIGTVHTSLQKKKSKIYATTKVNMVKSNFQWVDSTIVRAKDFKPIYHSSNNEQRQMELKFGQDVTGFYKDHTNGKYTEISEALSEDCFDSNFYPQLIRVLPLDVGYTAKISIFDYNPTSRVGIMSATLHNTESVILDFNGMEKKVWKLETSNDISNNKTMTTFYIDQQTHRILKQVTTLKTGQLVMERERID